MDKAQEASARHEDIHPPPGIFLPYKDEEQKSEYSWTPPQYRDEEQGSDYYQPPGDQNTNNNSWPPEQYQDDGSSPMQDPDEIVDTYGDIVDEEPDHGPYRPAPPEHTRSRHNPRPRPETYTRGSSRHPTTYTRGSSRHRFEGQKDLGQKDDGRGVGPLNPNPPPPRGNGQEDDGMGLRRIH